MASYKKFKRDIIDRIREKHSKHVSIVDKKEKAKVKTGP
jgi:hypothetical protein